MVRKFSYLGEVIRFSIKEILILILIIMFGIGSSNKTISTESLNEMIYISDEIDFGTVIFSTKDWIQPSDENEIVRITSFIANVITKALLKSQKIKENKFDVLVYLESFKIKQINYQFVKYLADILKQLFPEKLRKAVLVDPPSIFIHSYEIIKKFIDKPTRAKMSLISTKENRILYDDVMDD
jgi:hypothetical protein